MKKSLLVFLLAICWNLSAQQIELISQDQHAITIRCTLDNFETTEVQTPQGTAIQVFIEEGTPLLKAGAPEVPKLTASYILNHFQAGNISIESESYTDYEEVLLAPSKGNLFRNVDPADVPYEFGEVYETDVFYPRQQIQLREPHVFRDFRAQTAVFYPVQYNAVQRTLRVYDEIVVKIAIKEDAELLEAMSGRAAQNIPEPFDHLYNKRYLNYHLQERYDPVTELGSMLIIAQGEFIPQLEELVRWKNQKGIPTEVVDIATIGDDPAVVKAFVDEYYTLHGNAYLLLVGDETMVPTQQTSQQNACDHCYAHQAGDDHYPEFLVGRFNAEDAEQLQTMLDRNMIYELNPGMENPDWFATAIGMGSAEGPGDDEEYDYEHLNNIKIDLLDFGFAEVYEFYDGSQAASSPTPESVTVDGPGNPSAPMINEVIDRGATLVNYTGHGGHGVLSSGNFDNNAINQLTNYGAYPFLIAVACCVGDFQNDFGNGPCLGDEWIRATDNTTGLPAGGIGGCFSSILQSWAPPMEGQDEMNKLLIEAGTYDIRQTMGGLVVHGGGAMIDAYGGGGDAMMDTWNIFGDPSVVLWSQTPDTLLAEHIDATFIGTNQLDVLCEVENALVGLYYEGRNIAYGTINGGVATLDFEPLDYPSAITVTVTAYNYLPYQGEIQVTPLEGPYVIVADYELDDSTTGNNNSLADYSETIALNVTMSNVGLDTARAVQSTLSTEHAEITLINDVFNWGDIEAEQAMSENAAFSFSVAEYIEDQTIVNFLLKTIDDEGNVWEKTIPVILNAPVLEIGAVVIDDTAEGNGNGRLDPGENAMITFPNLNVGYSISPEAEATVSTTSPYLDIMVNTITLGVIEDNVGASFAVSVAEEVPIATAMDLVYNIAAGPYQANTMATLNANLIVEDFELDSLNSDLYGWDNTNEHPWFLTDYLPYAGVQCLQSAEIGDNNYSSISIEKTTIEDGEFSFATKVSTEADWDYLFFYIDGVEMAAWSGEKDWEEVSFTVPAGDHVFTWDYVKDQLISDGLDAAWIDDIIFPPFEVVISDIDDERAAAADLLVAPNPTHSSAIVSYQLASSEKVKLSLVNSQGLVLQNLVNQEYRQAATHQLKLDLSDYPAGIYYLLLSTATDVKVAKIVKQ
jgi:hypothetical protein